VLAVLAAVWSPPRRSPITGPASTSPAGWEIDTSVGVLIATLAIAVLALWLFLGLITRLMRLPGGFAATAVSAAAAMARSR